MARRINLKQQCLNYRVTTNNDKIKAQQNCKKLKGSPIYINKDFCQAMLQYTVQKGDLERGKIVT